MTTKPPDGAPAAGREPPPAAPSPDGRFPIVGIGASAGGLEALEALVQRLAADGMAYVVLQHLSPDRASSLPEILSRKTPLEVITARDAQRLQQDHIYVAPPNVEVVVEGGVLRLSPPSADRRLPRLSIDLLLRSLAADRGSAAIGVVLSGAGTDGTLGLRAIKEAGGITLVQEPSTASQPSMPQSAVDAGYADFCLTPAEIGDELRRLSTHPFVAADRPPRDFDQDAQGELFNLLRSAFGVDFTAYKQSTLDRRIQRRMALHRLDSLHDYLAYVHSNSAELGVLYGDLLIGVTSFFRDDEPFEALRAQVFPKLVDGSDTGQPLRIWVAGCSTGQEAYSIAISLLEYLEERSITRRIQLFATDIDEEGLDHARFGLYPPEVVGDLSEGRVARFFTRSDKGFQVIRAVRDMVIFARHNLGKDPPFSRIDLVSCRNVLIYMLPQLQRRILRAFHYALNPDAFLLLGSSESVGEASDLFSLVDRKSKLYAKKPGAAVFDFAPGGPADRVEVKGPPHERRLPLSVLQLADRKILDRYAPPGVLVDERFDVLQYRGRTGRFFDPTPGLASLNLLKLARPELLPELRRTLQAAIAGKTRVVSAPIHLRQDKELVTVRLDVTPLTHPETTRNALLVLFEEVGGAPPQEPPAGEAAPPAEPDSGNPRAQELEHELASTKDYLQSTIEELETANEELQSANEELQSANEELQSANEELETSKEELQSTNEELLTLNEELQNRMDQLNLSTDDLHNLLTTTSSAVVVLDRELRIRLFSTSAERLLQLVPGDIGRPFAYVRLVLKARDIEQLVTEAVHANSPREQRVRHADGQWYLMRMSPYRTSDQTTGGQVVEFLAAHLGRESQREAREPAGLGASVLAAMPQAVGLLNERLCLTWANPAFLKLFHIEADIFGRPFEDVWGGKAEQPDVWRLLEEASTEGRPLRSVVSIKPFGEPLGRAMNFTARPLPADDDFPRLTLVVVDEPEA